MNNVQSGIIGETMRKEHRAREKWVAQYSQQFGMPLSDPGSDDFNTLLPGPTIRMRKALPFAQAYVPSAYQAIEPAAAGAGAGAGAAKDVPAAGATKAQLSGGGAGDAARHHAPYAYADTAVAHNPRASFGASITRSGLKAAVAHGPVDPNAGLYVKGDNTVVPRPGHAAAGARVGVHPDMPAAGIKTRPPQQLLTHTKPNAANVGGALAPARNKIGAATAAQQGAGDSDDRVAQAVPIGVAAAAASVRGATPKYTESLAAAGAAIANGKSSGAPGAERPLSARPLSASVSARLNASYGGGAAGAGAAENGNGDLSATQLSAYNPALRPASAAVPPTPNLALQKSATLYTALNFAVKDTDQMGVLITKVDRKSAAEDAGLKKGDLIAYVNNRPTRSVDEFFAVAAHAQGTLYLTIRRRGVAKLVITLKPK